MFELNCCEVTWSSVKSFSDLFCTTSKHKRCCYLSFSLSLVYKWVAHVWLALQRIF